MYSYWNTALGWQQKGLPAVEDTNTSNDRASDVDECARITKWLGDTPLGGIPRFGPKPRRTMSWSGGVYAPHGNLHDSASCSLCLSLMGSFLSLDVSLVSSPQVPHAERMCYGGLVMCEPGGSKTYTIPLPKTGLSGRAFYNKSGAECFFDPCDLSLWTRQVMTDDKRQVQPINEEWRSIQGTLTGSGRVDHVQFGLDLQLSAVLRRTLFKEETT